MIEKKLSNATPLDDENVVLRRSDKKELANVSLSNLSSTGQAKFDAKANVDLSNLSSTGEKHFVNKTQLTNCILEIPQNIKYTLEDGVLTIKAGTIVTVPYGTTDQSATYPVGATFLNNNFKVVKTYFNNNKFFVQAEVQADVNVLTTYSQEARMYALVGITSNSILIRGINDADFSYNETDNLVVDTELSASYPLSFPCLIGTINMEGISAVNQVFNGMGYIGNTVFVNPRVKVLITTAVNDDGSKENTEYTTDSIYLGSTTASNIEFVIALTSSSFNTRKNAYVVDYSSYSISPVPPENTTRWLNSQNGLFYILRDGVWGLDPQVHLGFGTISDGVITDFQPFGTVSVADDQTVLHKWGNETIKGIKNFEDAIKGDNGIVLSGEGTDNPDTRVSIKDKNYSAKDGTPPANIRTTSFRAYNADNTIRGDFRITAETSGDVVARVIARRYSADGSTNKNAEMSVRVDSAGNMFAQAPTYTGNYADNSNIIVTTAYMANHWVTAKATTTSSASKARPAVVVQNYLNGTSWYRVWSDGFIEQAGQVSMGGKNPYTVALLRKFSTNTYYVSIQAGTRGTEQPHANQIETVFAPTTSNFKFVGNYNNMTVFWYACGY